MGMVAIYRLSPGQAFAEIKAELAWQQQKGAEGFPAGYGAMCSYHHGGEAILLAMDAGQSRIDSYRLDDLTAAPVFEQHTTVSTHYDLMSSFMLAGQPHVVAYQASTGVMDFFRVTSQRQLEVIYSYRQSYGAVSSGYTTLLAYDYQGMMLLLAYNQNSGDVAIYQLQVTSSAPLQLSSAWNGKWSPGWHHFGLFQWGGENFFIKSNVNHGNETYIDHLSDSPGQGSRPVGRHLPPLTPTALAPLAFAGMRCFVCYDNTGQIVINRIDSDGTGWTPSATFSAVTDGSTLQMLYLVQQPCLLVY